MKVNLPARAKREVKEVFVNLPSRAKRKAKKSWSNDKFERREKLRSLDQPTSSRKYEIKREENFFTRVRKSRSIYHLERSERPKESQ